ncbi:adenosylcobinamide-GDP ribazoletransferase [Roseibium sp.]|uniref:adenosylcobinamide-GDP ribazoletransferase n=1 Tax=Roseibium sp. TaxID=1936156 RepID=UPI003B500198
MPLQKLNAADDPAALPDFNQISRAAPLAGAFVALPAAGLLLVLGATSLPPLVVAVIAAAVLTIVTGALHEDGLSDVADGFFGGATISKRLEIMKDSRIGAFGAIALVFAIVLRVALIAAFLDRFGAADTALLIVTSEAFSRFLMVWQWHRLPLARPDGLGARFGKPSDAALRQCVLVMMVLLLPALLALPLQAAGIGIGIAGAAALSVAQVALSKINGTTGDVLGAIQQISGLGFLTGVLMVAV